MRRVHHGLVMKAGEPGSVPAGVHFVPANAQSSCLFVTSFLKNVTFWPAGTKLFETGRNVTIRLVKHSYFLPSQICHLSWKREVGRPFGLRPTLSVFQCVECVVVCYIVNISRAAATAFDQISSRGSIQCVCCSVL